MNIILCGPPGSGKTTVGAKAALKAGIEFIDTDHLIENRYAVSCREFFSREGEKAFRSLEKEAIASLPKNSRAVIALGGGTLDDRENFTAIKKFGRLIYLYAPVPFLLKRAMADGLPAFLEREEPFRSFEKLMTRRKEIYEKAADAMIDISLYNEDQILDFVLAER